MWLNLCGSEAFRHKLKNGLKTPKMHFLPVFELMLDILTTIQVEPHQCPCINTEYSTNGLSYGYSEQDTSSAVCSLILCSRTLIRVMRVLLEHSGCSSDRPCWYQAVVFEEQCSLQQCVLLLLLTFLHILMKLSKDYCIAVLELSQVSYSN